MKTCEFLWRSIVCMSACFVFALALPLSAQQNQSSPQRQQPPTQSSGPIAEARSSLAHGDAEEAIRILSSYLQTHPKETSARTLLGQAYASTGQNDRAENEFQTALQNAPNNFIALASLGEIYEREGHPEKAELMLAHAATASRGDPHIRTEWAIVLARLHKYKEARSALAGVPAPNNREERIGFYRLKASVALGLGNAPEAASEMEKALALDPTNSGIVIATALAEVQSENWQRAASLAEPLFSGTHDPQVGLVLVEAQLGMHADFHPTLELLRSTQVPSEAELSFRQRLAELLISHGQFSDAIDELKAAADLDPGQPEPIFNLALAQYRAGRLDDALASGEKCKELGDNADLEDLLGDIQEARGDNLAAAKNYQAAVALAPNEEKYRLSLAVEFIRHGNFDAAKIDLKQAEGLQPNSWRIQLALGMVEYFSATDEGATKYLLHAAELAPEPDTALKYLGDIQMDRASAPDPDAIAKLCEYADRQPKNGDMQYYCGGVLFRRDSVVGDKTHSSEILRRLHVAAGLLPKDASPHCQLGKAYRWLDNWQEALGESEICARMDPGSADAHYRLAQIYEHVGKRELKIKEIKLYEAASTRVADENARREATLKTFLYSLQNEQPDHK